LVLGMNKFYRASPWISHNQIIEPSQEST
jgi:hypothetical protein